VDAIKILISRVAWSFRGCCSLGELRGLWRDANEAAPFDGGEDQVFGVDDEHTLLVANQDFAGLGWVCFGGGEVETSCSRLSVVLGGLRFLFFAFWMLWRAALSERDLIHSQRHSHIEGLDA